MSTDKPVFDPAAMRLMLADQRRQMAAAQREFGEAAAATDLGVANFLAGDVVDIHEDLMITGRYYAAREALRVCQATYEHNVMAYYLKHLGKADARARGTMPRGQPTGEAGCSDDTLEAP